MSKSIRIRTTPGGADNFVKIKLDQDFDFLEILSLKISQEEVYRKFCADYGVVVGRVIANNGFGVPNAKLSIFIPITEEDKDNDLISGLYPYENVTDKDSEGIRYNLLPKTKQSQCHTPVGTMPSKREVLDNDVMLEIYDKYYKFTTTTNKSGDYMIFGVPTGSNIIHMDVDISDIGTISQRPYDMIRQGSSKNQFESPNKFKSSKNLDVLTQIKSSNVGVNVVPFWGDSESCEVGISRVDINLPYLFEPTAIFIGSLFSDTDKHSVNKNCRPRKKTGKLCEMVTGEGVIEMIRKDLDGNIERYDVEGLSAIDENGTWAYQIPMNLDYKVTDEFGNLVDSGDPSKGIPTRSRVRFRVSMLQSGYEGRIRTRARYLIPNNPSDTEIDDYTFDETTSDSSFFNLYWNKVYTVRNFIARYQKNDNVNNRNFIGIKDVDDCGTHSPFPFNRVDTDFNPLYIVICTIAIIMTTLIGLINTIVIPIINLLVEVVNVIIRVIGKICTAIDKIASIVGADGPDCSGLVEKSPVKCITISCDDSDYAPGCGTGSKGYDELGTPKPETDGDKLRECLRLQLAEALNVFEFDFYNDWINGSLYLPLLKYKNKTKKKNKGVEKFCEYDCSKSGIFTGRDGTDNECEGSNYLVDSCVSSGARSKLISQIKEGIVKKVGDELYYPARTHISKDLMYATDITLIGSTLDCDSDNIPIIHHKLPATSYNKPDLVDTNNENDECGLVPLIFDKVTCIRTDAGDSCGNLRILNELGVDIPTKDNCDVTDSAISDLRVRNEIIGMNLVPLKTNYNTITGGFLGSDYITFRNKSGTLSLPKNNSLFFYFGIVPGKSAIEKARNNFFSECSVEEKYDFIIDGDVVNNTIINGSSGSITIEVIDGIPPYTYKWVKDGSSTVFSTSQNINNLVAGVYKVSVIDSLNYKSEALFTVTSPQPLDFNLSPTNVSSNGGSDGQITVSSLYSGIGPYVVEIISLNKSEKVNNGSVLFSGLKSGTYSVRVTDEDGLGKSLSKNVTIDEPPVLTSSITSKNITCNGGSDGEILISISGGVPPYKIKTTGPTIGGVAYESSDFNQRYLPSGTYNIIISDSVSGNYSTSKTLTQPNIVSNTSYGTVLVVNTTLYGYIVLKANGGSGTYKFEVGKGGKNNTYTTSGPYTISQYDALDGNGYQPLVLNGNYNVKVTDSNGCVGGTIVVNVSGTAALPNSNVNPNI